MNKIQFVLPILIVMFFPVVYAQEVDDIKIYVAPGKYEDYYHIKYTLTPENTFLTLDSYFKYDPSKYEFTDGLFQLFIPKDKFPIRAPYCKEYIILRMPMTITDNSPERDKLIAEKKVVFDQIKEMKKSGKGEIDIVIELNPYVKVKKESPLVVELMGCNVFFRNAYGRYIDYVGQLKQKIIQNNGAI